MINNGEHSNSRERIMSRGHLKQVNENYFRHMFSAMSIVFILLYASLIITVHAVFPFIWANRGTGIIGIICEMAEQRRRQAAGPPEG